MSEEGSSSFPLGNAFGLAGAGLQLLGGISSYYASKANASIMRAQGRIDNEVAKANATALELQGQYNAAVQRNNAIGAANQKKYENSIIKANRIALAQKFENQRERTLRNVRASGAEAIARNPQLSKDVINSIEMEAFSQMSDENLEYTMAMQSMGAQMTENDRVAALQSMYGELQAQNTLQGARNNAFFTRLSGQNAQSSANLRAGQMKLQARSDLIGSFASSISSAAIIRIMAIRVSSNTPQQREASAETFGYIRSYRSPLEGVQAADTGRGLQQAGQALQNVASVMKRKEDEAGKLSAESAYNAYDARLKAANDGLKNAYDKGNKEEQAQFRAQFDSLNPENKDFVLGTEVDKKYYEPYLGALAKNWKLHDIAHKNAKHQYTIRNDLIEHVDNGTNTVAQFRLQKDIGFRQYGEQIDKITVAGTKSSIDALSSDRAKNAYRGDMSNLARSVYHEQILRARNPEDLDAIQQDLLTRLTVPGGLSTFFGETDQRAIESTILSRKGQMVANDFAELKAIAADDLNKVVNNISQISAEIDSLDNPELPILMGNVRELWESIDTSKLSESGKRTHKSHGAILSKFNPNVHYNPDTGQEVNVGTDFSIDIKAMTKDPNYVIPVDEDLRPEEATKYRTMVENTVNRAKTAFQNGGGTDALKVLLGKDYDPSTAKDAAIVLGYPSTPLTNLPTVEFPNDPLNDDAARNTYFDQLFSNNSATQVMAYGTYVTNQAQTNAERFQGYLITQIAGDVARGVDPNTLVERTALLSGLTRIGSAGMNIEEQNAYNRFFSLAERQSTEFQMPILAEIERARRDGAVFLTNQEGTGYLDNLLKGMFLNAYREKDQNKIPGLNEKKEVYNKVLQFDAKAVSVMNGFLSNSDHVSSTFGILSNSGAMDVRLPPSMSDEVEYNRLKFAPFGFTGLKRTIGTSDQFTYFGEQFGERKMLLDEKARRAAFVGVHWLVHNGDITYQSLLQQKLANGQPNPLIAHFQEVAEEVDLNNLDESDLFAILMESQSIGIDGTARPTLQMIDFAETADKELGSVIGVWNYDANEYQPLIYTDNRMAVVPHSHLEEYERIMSTAREQGYELQPFYNLGADTSYDILERIRSGQDLFDDEVGDLPDNRKLEIKARRVSLRGGPQITLE